MKENKIKSLIDLVCRQIICDLNNKLIDSAEIIKGKDYLEIFTNPYSMSFKKSKNNKILVKIRTLDYSWKFYIEKERLERILKESPLFYLINELSRKAKTINKEVYKDYYYEFFDFGF